jgi:Phytochelatin synthase
MKNLTLAIILCCSTLANLGCATANSTLIYWDSAEGVALRSHIPQDADYWQLSSTFAMQNTQTFCSVASAITVLNALPIKKPVDPLYKPYAYFTQSNFFSPEVRKFANPETVLAEGMTREQLTQSLLQQGVNAESIAGDSFTTESLRTLLQKTLGDDGKFVLVNYLRTTLGQVGGGHWSVLAAFDEKTNRVLILDVAKYKYTPVWIEINTLQQAIATIDSTSSKARGLILVFE